jgi:hypothetical protein
LSQSTPHSALFWNWPPGTPFIEPEVSSTMSMLALRIWRSMTASGFTRASASCGAAVQIRVVATATRTKNFVLGPVATWPAKDLTRRTIGRKAGFIENTHSGCHA